MNMNYKFLLAASFLFIAAGSSVSAINVSNTSTVPGISALSTTSISVLIEHLEQRGGTFKAQIEQLQKYLKNLKEAKQEIKEISLQLKNQLKEGARSDDVKLLQEFLASDPDVYPEGKITGYFGQATKRAVQRLQKKFCVSTVGSVGPQTLKKINEILSEGAGNSGKIPEGLLKAPGIQKKLCDISTSTASNVTKIIDVTAPVISDVSAVEAGTSSAKIFWKTNEWADGKIYYSGLAPVDVSATTTLSVAASGMFKMHNLTVADLVSSTTIYYFVVSQDSSGNSATSSESFFTTLAE